MIGIINYNLKEDWLKNIFDKYFIYRLSSFVVVSGQSTIDEINSQIY